MGFTHFDDDGNAIMVDVSDKEITKRTAYARGTIQVNHEIIEHIKNNTVEKGDVLGVARIAGIMAAKKTSDMIPLCHILMITNVTVDFEIDEYNNQIHAFATVKCKGKTGVEMEALHAVSVTLLTIYDMCKAISKEMEIKDIHLLKKTGGKSGEFNWQEK